MTQAYEGSLRDVFRVGGIDFHVDMTSGKQRRPSTTDAFTIVKSLPMLNYYFNLADRLQPKAVLELGVFQGGSFVLLDRLLKPDTIVGVELDPPFAAMTEYLARQTDRTTAVEFNTSQADEARIPQILDQYFPDGLDLVIDDASHTYELTRQSLQLIWPRLNQGGTYIIEDWAWSHKPAAQSRRHASRKSPAMTNLIFELIADLGTTANVASVSIVAGRFNLVKGPGHGEILTNLRLRGRDFSLI